MVVLRLVDREMGEGEEEGKRERERGRGELM
jgi:hypothetical protein